jgi:hypothetical protein
MIQINSPADSTRFRVGDAIPISGENGPVTSLQINNKNVPRVFEHDEDWSIADVGPLEPGKYTITVAGAGKSSSVIIFVDPAD